MDVANDKSGVPTQGTQRDIRFRAWNGRKMLYPQFPKDGYINVPLEFSEDSSLVQEPQQSIYMQYTGLKDKNGVPIYEGDLLQVSNKMTFIKGPVRQVVWNTETARFNGIPLLHEKEVIGNVYENKELL